MANTLISVAYGDGVGPEIMAAVLGILKAAGAATEIEPIEIGPAGVEPASWESLRRTRVFLKAPTTTPAGGQYRSFNVTVRQTLGLYANVRPCVSYHPFIETLHPDMDVVIIRESEEDLYTGIEYRLGFDEMESLKLISRPGCERIARYAFEYARRHNRRKVACFTKDNILAMSDGLFHQVFDEVASAYPDIEHEHWFVDAGAAQLADLPAAFDIIVLPNLYGDILSEVAAQIAGSIGLAPSANIGELCAMFEAMHGASPRQAGRNLANPSGLLLAAVLMLVHIGQPEIAARVHNAWLRAIEDGIHTYDIYSEGVSAQKAGTKEFACAVVARLGQRPNRLRPAVYTPAPVAHPQPAPAAAADHARRNTDLVGVDVYVEWLTRNPRELAALLAGIGAAGLQLDMLANRGVKVWPAGIAETFCTDTFRCRFLVDQGGASHRQVLDLLARIAGAGLEIVKTEYLRRFDGQPGFSAA